MAKLYGKGTIVELIAGKKYKITFSYGKDPDTGAYRRHVERFLGTKRQAELRVEELRVRYERIDELRKLGLDFEELESYGLDVDIIISMGMSDREVVQNLAQRKEERAHSITFGDYIEQYMRARETMGWILNKIAFGADANRTAVDGINSVDIPVLIIHGDADGTVLYDGASIIAQQDAITNPNVQYFTFSEEWRNGHNTYFYDADANAYFGQKSDEFAAIIDEYDTEIPDDVLAAFQADYDIKRANVANPELIDMLDSFFSVAIGR